jgi:hypothetical protein
VETFQENRTESGNRRMGVQYRTGVHQGARMAKPRGTRGVVAYPEEADYARLEGLARANGRSIGLELNHSQQGHLADPPRVDVPPLRPASPHDLPARKPGRKRKEAAS